MFANILLLSLLTIIYGTKGDEGGGGSAVDRNVLNFLPDISQQHSSDDLNFIKTPRSIRTPFRNTEIMTARGFGKRDGEEQEYSDNYNERKINTDQQINDDYRDEAYSNHFRQQLLFPFTNQMMRAPENLFERDSNIIPAIKNHRLQIRDGTLKFRLNDGNLRIGRGFGKRNYGADPYIDKWVHRDTDFKLVYKVFSNLQFQSDAILPEIEPTKSTTESTIVPRREINLMNDYFIE